MSAIDELRRLLDERGVAHSDHYFSTTWRDGHGILHLAGEPMADGSLVVDMLTPEQAIAATLGNSRAERTCKQEERGWGTEGDHARVWLTCGHDCMVPTVQDLPNYCPNCGAKLQERIVRCRDCKFKDEPWNCAAPYYVEPDGFCKWGERKKS